MRYDLNGEGCQPSTMPVIQPVNETDYQVVLRFGARSENELKRLLGCIAVWAIPERGLDEVLESLRDALEFYARDVPRLPQAVVQSQVSSAMVARRGKVADLIITE